MAAPTQKTLCPICHTLNRSDAQFCQQCGNNIWLANKYRIVHAIKEGGMGAVYEAIDDSGKRYALKALIDRFTDQAERKEAIERFQEEASLLRELKHPRIPRVYDHFLHGGRYYLAMDFVEGSDLEDLLKRQPEKRFSEPMVLRWADQIADVLDYLHERRLIYRDMKPSNVMIERATGDVKLVDFGIAKLFQPHQRGTLIGTPGYSPPEQYQGQATPQSDVFALGATLHHLLTGRDPRDEPPFSFPSVRSLVPEVSQATDDAIMRALKMDQDQRWQSAAAFRAALPLELTSKRPGKRQPAGKPQATVALDPTQLAADVSAVPQPQQAAPTARPKAPKPTSQPKQPPSKPAKQAPRRRFRWWIPLAVVLVVGVLILLGQPAVSERLSNLIPHSTDVPTIVSSPTSAPRLTERFNAEVTATVPLGSSDDTIRAALVESFKQAAMQKFGADVQFPPSSPPASIGAPTQISATDTDATYQVMMQGYVSYPQP